MVKGFSRTTVVKGIVCAVSAVVFDFLMNKKTWPGVKKKLVNFRNCMKHVTAEGADAYRKGRDSVLKAGGDENKKNASMCREKRYSAADSHLREILDDIIKKNKSTLS